MKFAMNLGLLLLALTTASSSFATDWSCRTGQGVALTIKNLGHGTAACGYCTVAMTVYDSAVASDVGLRLNTPVATYLSNNVYVGLASPGDEAGAEYMFYSDNGGMRLSQLAQQGNSMVPSANFNYYFAYGACTITAP